MREAHAKDLLLFLCGDVMTGRGIDQALPHPGRPDLFESYITDARDYIRLAQQKNGPFPLPLRFDSIWGEALDELARRQPDLRIINLETSVTRSDDVWPGKAVNYRMYPQNIECLRAASVNVCSLANNHVLDWGHRGLAETIETLDRAGIAHAGAGGDIETATKPALLNVSDKARVLLFAYGSLTSGIPPSWGADIDRAGLNILPNLSDQTARRVIDHMQRIKQPGDIAIASIHWGNNWGYDIPQEQTRFARRLIDGGFALIHGHSSHHVRTVEAYQNHLILYGCGDFLNDYEGIRGYEAFRGDLTLMHFVRIAGTDGTLQDLRLVPLQMRRFRLERASPADAEWLCDLLNQLGNRTGPRFTLEQDNSLRAEI